MKRQQAAETQSRADGKFTMWPAWKHNTRTLTSTPTVTTLMTIEQHAYEQVRTTGGTEGVGGRAIGGVFSSVLGWPFILLFQPRR